MQFCNMQSNLSRGDPVNAVEIVEYRKQHRHMRYILGNITEEIKRLN
jgi:hypothetical protein